jgi:hypothetical protein
MRFPFRGGAVMPGNDVRNEHLAMPEQGDSPGQIKIVAVPEIVRVNEEAVDATLIENRAPKEWGCAFHTKYCFRGIEAAVVVTSVPDIEYFSSVRHTESARIDDIAMQCFQSLALDIFNAILECL